MFSLLIPGRGSARVVYDDMHMISDNRAVGPLIQLTLWGAEEACIGSQGVSGP
jgi:hypothetical protein